MDIRTSSGIITACLAVTSLISPGSARAQLGDPLDNPGSARPLSRAVGSVTVTSDPSGAIVSLDGHGIHLVGRTPWTVSRGLEGVFTLRAHLHVHEEAETVIYLNPADNESVHMNLHAKTPAKAGLRSVLLPGWGQHYSDRDAVGGVFFGAAVAATVYLGIKAIRYEDKVDDLDAAWQRYLATTVQSEREDRWLEVERRRGRAGVAQGERNDAWAVLGLVWGINLLDALFFFPDTSSPIVTRSTGDTGLFVEPRPDGMDLGLRVGY